MPPFDATFWRRKFERESWEQLNRENARLRRVIMSVRDELKNGTDNRDEIADAIDAALEDPRAAQETNHDE